MKTKGALLWEFNQPWSIEEIEIGDPQRGEVKIAMEAAGMCHSDHHLMTGSIPMAFATRVMCDSSPKWNSE